MKRLFTLLLVGLLIAACSEKTESDTQWLPTPTAEVVANSTTITVSCATRFGDGVLDNLTTGFAYAAISNGSVSAFTETTDCTVKGNILTATLRGLTPQTRYLIYAFAEVASERTQSAPVLIETGENSDSGDPAAQPTFGTPAASELTQSGATLSCSYAYTGTAATEVWFVYAAASGAEQRVTLTAATPGVQTTQLTGLSAATAYTFRLCVAVDGVTYTSATGSFTTSAGGGNPSGSTETYRSGWAELIPEDATKANSEYFYAYHLCPDYPATGTKARNFSTCYSKSKLCPVWVAAPLHDCYTGSVDRSKNYYSDPDINCTQVEKRDGYTRGHMLGSNERRVTSAVNHDVFYLSNIAPQIQEYFNTGGGQWNTAEDWVDKQWRGLADTCYQVVGCYWENTSTVASGTTIPTHFYIVLLKAKKSAGKKWVVNCSADELQSIAIMVRHKAYAKSEVVAAADFQSKGVFKSVAEIEQLTGHKFFPNVPNAPKNSYNPSDWNF